MESFPCDVTTLIISILPKHDLISLLAAFPNIKVKWNDVYSIMYEHDTLSYELRQIHDEYFTIKKKDRIEAMRSYYDKVIVCNDSYDDDDAPHNIQIVESFSYKLEDYIYSIEDDLYSDIARLKVERGS